MTTKGVGFLGKDFSRCILDAMPLPIFVVETDVRIVDYNAAAAQMVKQQREQVIHRRAGEVLHCLHSLEGPEGCGTTSFCHHCMVRNSVNDALQGRPVSRRAAKRSLVMPGDQSEASFLVSATPFDFEEKSLALVVLEDISEVNGLRRMLPICAGCKQIRDDKKYWHEIENYFRNHMDISFTHSLCPDCARKYYPECFDENGNELPKDEM